ncbi:uncharacterized protein LOC104901634 [Beta vulgaris subsp. vulgaris]|uniref:uncharacterized protein LOC104901634 n=1 Tax=Beta vulgaris subsp. vulgaris TaxID=3555 RepID=UPI0005402B4F|nr:uncharacterized protein LOC104901634 [Beta vulgaris subsp. vulgaris]
MLEQFIHCFLKPVNGDRGFYVTFIYAFNERGRRMKLWEELRMIIMTSDPWLLCGDFNCVMNTEERIGAPVREAEMVDIRACMIHCGLQDIKASGNFYTWNNKQEGVHRVFSKIDRMVANKSWLDAYPSAEASFHNEGEFDHTLVMLTIHPGLSGGKNPFKYFTMWRSSPKFLEIIRRNWRVEVQGTRMFQVLKKLKNIKVDLRRLNKEGYSDIQAADVKEYNIMMEAQQRLHGNPSNLEYIVEELESSQSYKITHQAYVELLSQKVKAMWIKDGDENTSLFHQSIRSRKLHNLIYSIYDENGSWCDNPGSCSHSFLSYYQKLLGGTIASKTPVIQQLV